MSASHRKGWEGHAFEHGETDGRERTIEGTGKEVEGRAEPSGICAPIYTVPPTGHPDRTVPPMGHPYQDNMSVTQ